MGDCLLVESMQVNKQQQRRKSVCVCVCGGGGGQRSSRTCFGYIGV